MQAALDYFATPNTTPLYSEIFFNRQYRFQYPPSALFTLQGLQWLAPDNVRTNEVQTFPGVTLNDLVGWAFILATGLAAAALLELQLRKRYAVHSRVLLAARVAIVAGFTLTFYPIVKAYTLGQLQVWINGLFAVALLCWATRLEVAVRLAGRTDLPDEAALRPVPGVGAAARANGASWPCARPRSWPGSALSVLVFGFANHIDYLRVRLVPRRERGEAYYPNHSINGLLNRIMGIADPDAIQATSSSSPASSRRSIPGSTASPLSSSARDPRCRTPASQHRPAIPPACIDFCLMALSCTMASPDRLGAPLRHPAADLRRAGRSGRAETSVRSACWPRPTRWPASTSRPPCCWHRRRSTSRSRICCLPR